MVFYCTRCGARLQSQDGWSSARVRCGSCAGVTRTPDPESELPVASLADPEPFPPGFLDEVAGPIGDDDLDTLSALLRPGEAAAAGGERAPAGDAVPFANAVSLDYATPRQPRFVDGVEDLAEKLANVEVAEDGGDSMHECPHCGSRITTYARKCPFCRHPLLGP